MKIRVINPTSKYFNETGIILNIDKGCCPNTVVLLDCLQDEIPELGLRYFWQEDLEEIKEP